MMGASRLWCVNEVDALDKIELYGSGRIVKAAYQEKYILAERMHPHLGRVDNSSTKAPT
jgi:hypothetical protein